MHFGKISYMLWLSQVFENVNIADTLELYDLSCYLNRRVKSLIELFVPN
jgi:hypothetical protein